jgi:hypothetical protein
LKNVFVVWFHFSFPFLAAYFLKESQLTVVPDWLLYLLLLLSLVLEVSFELSMMNADGRVLSPGPVAANDGGRTDQFVVGALAAELDQETGPQDEHLAVVGRLWLEASRFQFHFCIASTGLKK